MVEESAITCRYALATASTTRSRLLLYEFWEAFRRSFDALKFCTEFQSKSFCETFPRASWTPNGPTITGNPAMGSFNPRSLRLYCSTVLVIVALTLVHI